MTGIPRWERVLWKQQPFPDNYTDPDSFLSSTSAAGAEPIDISLVRLDALSVAAHFSFAGLFVALFSMSLAGQSSPGSLLIFEVVVLVLGYVLEWLFSPAQSDKEGPNTVSASAFAAAVAAAAAAKAAVSAAGKGEGASADAAPANDAKELRPEEVQMRDAWLERTAWSRSWGWRTFSAPALFVGSCYSVAPVLRTLTEAWSDDTIYALAIGLLLTHLWAFDYSYLNNFSDRLVAPTSLNAAITAAIILASRLPTAQHVFSIVCCAIIIFGMSPVLRHRARAHSTLAHTVISLAIVSTGVAVMAAISPTAALSMVAINVFVVAGSPAIMQRTRSAYRKTVSGPWDIPLSALNFNGKRFDFN